MNKENLRILIRESVSQVLNEYVTRGELKSLESYLDRLFSNVGVDVEFTQHFIDRVNDVRNKKEIESEELKDLFVKTYKKWGPKIPKMRPETEAVITDMKSDINVPFVLVWDKNSQEFELVSKSVMRKRNFHVQGTNLKV